MPSLCAARSVQLLDPQNGLAARASSTGRTHAHARAQTYRMMRPSPTVDAAAAAPGITSERERESGFDKKLVEDEALSSAERGEEQLRKRMFRAVSALRRATTSVGQAAVRTKPAWQRGLAGRAKLPPGPANQSGSVSVLLALFLFFFFFYPRSLLGHTIFLSSCRCSFLLNALVSVHDSGAAAVPSNRLATLRPTARHAQSQLLATIAAPSHSFCDVCSSLILPFSFLEKDWKFLSILRAQQTRVVQLRAPTFISRNCMSWCVCAVARCPACSVLPSRSNKLQHPN